MICAEAFFKISSHAHVEHVFTSMARGKKEHQALFCSCFIYCHDFHHYWDSVLSEKRSLLTNIVFVIQIWSEWNTRGETKECFVSRTNALLVGTLSIGDVSLSIAISWKTIEGFISFGGWSIFITKVALQIYQVSVYIAVMFSVVQNQAQVVIALDRTIVCYTAVFSVVTQCSSPQSGEERCVTTLKTAV